MSMVQEKIAPKSVQRAGWLLALVLFLADRASKMQVLAWFPEGRGKIEVFSFMDVLLVWNYGISYGLLSSGTDWARLGLSAATGGLIILCALWLWRAQDRVSALALGAIIGGGLGNLTDRIIYGAVVDFISLHAAGFYWYVFNLADAAIVIGAFALFWFWRDSRPAGGEIQT